MMITVIRKSARTIHSGVSPSNAQIREPIQKGRQAQIHWGRLALDSPESVRLLMAITSNSPLRNRQFSVNSRLGVVNFPVAGNGAIRIKGAYNSLFVRRYAKFVGDAPSRRHHTTGSEVDSMSQTR